MPMLALSGYDGDESVSATWIREFLLLGAVIFGPLAFGCVEPWSRALLEGIFFALLLISVSNFRRYAVQPIHKTLLIGAVGLCILGFFQGLNPSNILQPRGWLPFTVSVYETNRTLLLWSSFIALLLGVPAILERPGASRRLAWTLVLVGLAVAVIGFLQLPQQFQFIYGFRPVPYASAPWGPYYNGGHASSMMALSFLVGLGLIASRFKGLDRYLDDGGRRSDFWIGQAFLLVFLTVIAAAILRQSNRGTLLATGIALWATGFVTSGLLVRRRAWMLRGLLLSAALAAGLTLVFNPTLSGLFKGLTENSVAFRIALNRDGIFLWRDYPVWGIGLGAVKSAFYAYKDPLVLGIADHVHNDWLELAIETGAVGFSIIALSLLLLFREVWRRWSDFPTEERWLRAGALAAALGFLIHALVEFSFHTPANAVLWLILLAWLGTRSPLKARSERRSSLRKPLRAALGAAALLLGALGFKPLIANMHHLRSRSPIWAERERHLLEAYRWDRDNVILGNIARFYFNTATKADELEAAAYFRKSMVWVDRGLERDPLDSYLRHLKGVILARLGRREDAKEFLPPNKNS